MPTPTASRSGIAVTANHTSTAPSRRPRERRNPAAAKSLSIGASPFEASCLSVVRYRRNQPRSRERDLRHADGAGYHVVKERRIGIITLDNHYALALLAIAGGECRPVSERRCVPRLRPTERGSPCIDVEHDAGGRVAEIGGRE